MKYNAVLRGLGGKVQWMKDKLEKLCDENYYVTTLHVINSAIVKLGRLAKPRTVYRGVKGGVLPRQFWKRVGNGGVEFAFMSTTSDRDVAMGYATGRSGASSTVMEIQMGMIDRGADLQWCSQYPHEQEITFAPFTGLEVLKTRVEGQVLIVELRLSVNLTTPTIEHVVSKMRSAHLQLIDLIRSNLRAADAPKRVLLALDGLRGAEAKRPADWFNNVQHFREATEMALKVQHEAFLVLGDERLWELERDGEEGEPNKDLLTLTTHESTVEVQKADATANPSTDATPSLVCNAPAADRMLRDGTARWYHRTNAKRNHVARMRKAAAACARAGEHDVAVSLLQQAFAVDGQAVVSLAKNAATARPPLLPAEQLEAAVKLVEPGLQWMIRLASHIVEHEVPAPWPATLVRLVDQFDNINDRDAIIEAISKTYAAKRCKPGLESLEKSSHVQVLQQNVVAGMKLWRRGEVVGWEPDGSLNVELGSGPISITPEQMGKGEVLIMPQGDTLNTSGMGAVLRDAATVGHSLLLKALLDAGVSVYEADSNGSTALHNAAFYGHEEAFKLLSERGANLMNEDSAGKRALDYIFEQGHVILARVSRPSQSDIEIRQLTPEQVDWPVKALRYDMALLLEPHDCVQGVEREDSSRGLSLSRQGTRDLAAAGARESKDGRDELQQQLSERPTASAPAVRSTDKLLLKKHRHEHSEEDRRELRRLAGCVAENGVNSLMLACRLPGLQHAMAAMGALLHNGSGDAINEVTKLGCTALSIAAEMGHAEVVEALLQSQARVDSLTSSGKTPLMLAAKNGHGDVCAVLLRYGASVELMDTEELFTPLMHASLFGHASAVTAVLASPEGKKGIDLAKPGDGFNALLLASLQGQVDVVQLLLRNRAHVDSTNSEGMTPLHLAAKKGHADVACALLQFGAKVNAVDKSGNNALHHCCITSGGEDVAAALLEVGADEERKFINAAGRGKNTALHFACMSGQHRMVMALVTKGADLELRNAEDKIPYKVAVDAGHDQVLEALTPVRTFMLAHLPEINTGTKFAEARSFVRDYGISRLARELLAPGYIDKETGQLTTGTMPFNVFARCVSGKLVQNPENKFLRDMVKANKRLDEISRQEGQPYSEHFMVCCNQEAQETNWNSSDPTWLGRASMAERHLFMTVKDLDWRHFNVLTFGMFDPSRHSSDSEDGEAENDRKRLELLRKAHGDLILMKEAALAYTRAPETDEKWSTNVGLFFNCYPHSFVNSLHMHIVDLSVTGPSYDKLSPRNLSIDEVIFVIGEELKALQKKVSAASSIAQVLEAGVPWPDDPVAAVAARLLPPAAELDYRKESWWDLIMLPPQQKLELSDTNKYSWPGATERQERCFYCATWNLLHDRGLGEALCSELRTHASERFPLYLGGNVPLNYYLMERFGAPAPIPSNDVDIKVDIGDHLRSLLRARGGADMPASHSDVGDHKTPDANERTAAEKELFRECKQETIKLFVEHAAKLMAEMAAVTKQRLPQIEGELAQHGFKLGPEGVHIHHKTHTAARAGKQPFHIVPVSGGVFQLMIQLTYAGHAFLWNVVDLEADWKLAGPCGKPAPCEVVAADAAMPIRGLKLLAPTALRADLEHNFQPNKEQRRAYKRDYWDWAAARHAEQNPAGRGVGK